jgi:hypothetical protein
MIASKTELQLIKVKGAGGDQGAKVLLVNTDGSPNAPVRRIMGSDAEQVVRTTRVPVLLVRSKATPRTSGKP